MKHMLKLDSRLLLLFIGNTVKEYNFRAFLCCSAKSLEAGAELMAVIKTKERNDQSWTKQSPFFVGQNAFYCLLPEHTTPTTQSCS